ncbi:MAG TPA: toll/interleukin-1 receptor domain-containing protein [Candidatus Didemnitutus sp.]|nr:toll/interleukin-1 receptor domain-containing protein [Candidatus Didemnitutus sp.]
MNADSPAAAVPNAMPFDDDAWGDLLNYIEEKRVIPLIGPELLTVQTETGPANLSEWLAVKLAQRLGLNMRELPPNPSLNDVVVLFLSRRGRREDAYTRIRTILRETVFAPPPALVKLAEITDFDLFVTTTFDSLLEDAVNQARFGGIKGTDVLAYAPNRVTDLPAERSQLTRPLIYHLLGRLSASPTYVISEEDTLEFVCALQSENYCPEKLFAELEHSHLLVLGGGFSDWLTRLFLRLAKRRRLSDPRDVGEVLAERHASHEPGLMCFLQQVSSRTRLFIEGAEPFIDELHRRWTARQRNSAAPFAVSGSNAVRFMPTAREMPEGAVFISYAREDLPAVQRMRAAFDAAGIVTWFDMERLEGGDDFERKIQRNVARCSFFIPVISATTQRRVEGWFRREWSWAVDRTRGMAEGAAFILPVCIDDTPEMGALVPDRFLSNHWSRLPGGEPTPEFTRRLRDLFGHRT